MWTQAFDLLARRVIRTGTLTIVMPDGSQHTYGDGTGTPQIATMHDPDLPRKFAINPDMALGEAYMEGKLTLENDDLRGFLTLVLSNLGKARMPWFSRPLALMHRALRRMEQFNPIGRAQANVAHHYDLSGELYDLFLDKDRQYSCAYFADPEMSLEDAQIAKKAHIAAKLRLEPGMRVLDIGCGWGGMALTLARDYGVSVVGVTLSREQHAIATQRAKDAGLSDRVDFRLTDYRNLNEQFDRIVSVGMFEHVGVPHYREYFHHVRKLMGDRGVALIHTIGRASPPGFTNGWITKYIFPGGYVPAMSEMMTAVEKEDLFTLDVEVWRLHYAETLKNWHARFMENIERAREIYDERFTRMWRYYLLASELTFRFNRQVVFQVQLAAQQDSVPLTRDYLYPAPKPQDMQHAAE